jgi:hypothetical protein
MVKNTKDNNFFILNQAEKAIDDCKFIFGDLEVLKENVDTDLVSVHYSRSLNSYLFRSENRPYRQFIDNFTRFNSDCTSLGIHLNVKFLVDYQIDKKKDILNKLLKKMLKYFTLNQLTKDIIEAIQLEADIDNLEFDVSQYTDSIYVDNYDELLEAISKKSNDFLDQLRDWSNEKHYYFSDYLKLLHSKEELEKNNLFVDEEYLKWVEKISIEDIKKDLSRIIYHNYSPQDWIKCENGIKLLSKDYISNNILKPEYANKIKLDYGLVQLIYKYHGFECAPDEFWKNFQTKRQQAFVHDFYFCNYEDKNDFIDMIVDIENEFGVKKQITLNTLEFRELSKAKVENSRSSFMTRLVSVMDTAILLESEKFFDMIQGSNRLFNFLSEFYIAMEEYDSLIVKDENYDKIIKAIEALSNLK